MSDTLSLLLPYYIALVGSAFYIQISFLVETQMLKKKRRLTKSAGNFVLGWFAIMSSIGTIFLSQSSTHGGLSGGILLAVGIACLIMGERFIYYPDTPTRKEE